MVSSSFFLCVVSPHFNSQFLQFQGSGPALPSPQYPVEWQDLSHPGKSFAEGHGREGTGLLIPAQALPRVTPQLLLRFRVAVPRCSFLLLFSQSLTQTRPSCMLPQLP